jgi:hypothetical protein
MSDTQCVTSGDVKARFVYLARVARSILREGAWCIPLIAVCAVTALVCAPGLYCHDSIDQLRQAREGVYQDWHPPMMAWFWRQCIHVGGSPSILAWAHLGMFLLGAVLVCWRLGRWSIALAASTACALCMPEVQNFVFVMWKDTAMAVAMLAAIGLQLNQPRRPFAKTVWIVAYVLTLVYAVGVRVNALPAVVPLALHLMWTTLGRGRRWRFLLSLGFGLCFALIIGALNTVVCYGVLGATRGAPQQTLQLFDMAGVAVRSGVDLIPDECKTDAYTPERLAAAYDVAGCMKLLLPMADGSPAPLRSVPWPSQSIWEEGVDRLGAAWRQAIMGQPLAYMQHRLAVCASLLRMGEEYSYYAVVTPQDSAGIPGHPGAGAGVGIEGGVAVKAAWLALMSWASGQTILMFGYPWMIALAASIAVALWRRAHPHAPLLMAVAFSGLLYALPYCIAAPASDFRYLYWSVMAAHLAVPLAVWVVAKGGNDLKERGSVRA